MSVVDDPRVWGRIAAQNAVADVYAMGGRPLLALNLVAWPSSELGADVLAGGADVAALVSARRRTRSWWASRSSKPGERR